MLLVLIRTLILYTAVVVALRLMGKREVGKLQPFELVVIILLSELAAIPMQNTAVPLINGLIPILVIVVAQVVLSYISLRSEPARTFICGVPSVVVANGRIVESEMHRQRLNINDLLEQLRAKNYPNIADVEFAILETSGHLSVIPKSQRRALCPSDLDLATDCEGLPASLIIDGYVMQKNLDRAGLTLGWLRGELEKSGIGDVKNVLFASLDTGGRLFLQAKAGKGGGGR